MKTRADARADRVTKSRIVDELVELTGSHRDWARAALRDALKLKSGEDPSPRGPTHRPRIIAAPITCWAVLRALAGNRLAPILPVLVPIPRRDGELDLTYAEAVLLTRISAATIDRQLAAQRARLVPRVPVHTKPGSLLKSQMPVPTRADWDDALPGFVEIDLAGHEGGNSSAEFRFTLTVTDVAPGWTINRSVRNKARRWVFQALVHALPCFPFPILRIDSDNGSEFINAHLTYCIDHQITFTRSRPGHSNASTHVDQKNWARVRQLVGYYPTTEPAQLNEIFRTRRALHQLPPNGASPQPDEACGGWAPVGGLTGSMLPVIDPPVAVVGLAGRPDDRSLG